MKINFEFEGQQFECELSDGVSLAIPMDFVGPQPNFYGVKPASSSPIELGEFVGDTTAGGSCNVDRIQLIPHCNGTHTETIGHIVDQDVFIGHGETDGLTTATVITVAPETGADVKGRGETYRPELEDADQVISRGGLLEALKSHTEVTTSLIVRTTSDAAHKSARFDTDHRPAFFSVEAMVLLVERGYRRLLVDLPSVDRMNDDGLLTNHHLFWNVKEGTHEMSQESWQDKTITEMIFVPDSIQDGFYLLSNQIPAFCSDAAPSRPVLYTPKRVAE